MKPSRGFLLLLPLVTSAYSPFKTIRSTEHERKPQYLSTSVGLTCLGDHDPQPNLLKFDPSGLLDSTSRKPEIYTKALLELKRLEEEPLCHRIAAQLLMKNCQGLDTLSDDGYQFNSVQIQRHHVESFAASLAICDLERGRFKIPDACSLFTSSILLSTLQTGSSGLDVSPEQVGECLEALGQHHSHWSTWLSYRDKALLFCRAARIDIDKDQAILLHKQLVQVMASLADAMERDLQALKEAMADHIVATDSYFDGIMVHAEFLKSKVLQTFNSFSANIEDISSSVDAATRSCKDVERVTKNISEMVIANSADLAAAHKESMEQQSQVTKSHLSQLATLANEMESSLGRAGITTEMILEMLMATYEQQQAIYHDIEFMLARSKNVTDFLIEHGENVEMISLVASDIHEKLGKTALSLKQTSRSSTGGLAVLVFSSLVTLMTGNYGLPPSLARNAGLLITGLAIGGGLNIYLDWASTANATYPISSTQLTRKWIQALPATVIDPNVASDALSMTTQLEAPSRPT
ncbi:hypothetical protein BP6252_06198 [Coleophoma cylindrospora]|uniref:Nuclear membrane fusion protein Kar5 n=1 Tax=Coleophoma cylindrospora TaxID=1849047 RepID=A0A3D8RM88_9HELO|nr:hypothetical protein BP6252_06198 [Coleophoma cylindrospora]